MGVNFENLGSMLGMMGVFGVALFLAWNYFLKNSATNGRAESCALAEEKVKALWGSIKTILDRQVMMEDKFYEQGAKMIEVVQKNTEANTLLAERLRS